MSGKRGDGDATHRGKPRDLGAVTPKRGWSRAHNEAAVERGYESWDHWCSVLAEDLGRQICGGKRVNQWLPCKQRPGDNGRCKSHGRDARSGAEHPNFKHGRYSKYLPDDLRSIYESLDVDELMTLLDHVRVASTLTLDLVARLDEEGGRDAWERLAQKLDALEAALADDGAGRQLFREVKAAVEEGSRRHELLEEIRKQQDHVRKLFDSQIKRDQIAAEYMHRREIIALLTQIMEDVKDVVQKPSERRAIGRRFVERLGPEAGALFGVASSSPSRN